MNTKREFNKKNIDNLAIVQNIKNLIYEKKLTLKEGMELCGYKTSHSIFNKWTTQESHIPMDSLVKIAAALGVDLFRIAPPEYFGISIDVPKMSNYIQHENTLMVEELNNYKDYVRLLKTELNNVVEKNRELEIRLAKKEGRAS